MMTWAGRILKARKQKGWTQAWLANRVGVHPWVVSRWETGVSEPHRFLRDKICSVLGIKRGKE